MRLSQVFVKRKKFGGNGIVAVITLELPDVLYDAVCEAARQQNVSVEDFITIAITKQLSALKIERGSRENLERALAKVADREPLDEDRL